jgi:CRP-like cAMP-binding protein
MPGGGGFTPLFVSLLIILLGAALFAVGATLYLKNGQGTPRRTLPWRIEQLRKVPFFKGLPDEQVAAIAKLVRELRVPEDVYVIREHRAGEAMYIVLVGSLHILKRGTHEQTLVQTVGPGEIIGEMALMTGTRRIASARSITPCLLLQIDGDDFHDLLKANGEVTRGVWEACELHSIDLSLRDHEKTRALSLPQRKAWIASRKSVTTEEGQRLVPERSAYLAVVAGAVEVGEHLHVAPELVRVSATDKIVVRRQGRVCWLPAAGETQTAA